MGLLEGIISLVGIGDALTGGIKTVELKVNHAKNLEELYDEIKDVPFRLGAPVIAKGHGVGNVIAYPAIDKNNQVQIWYYRKKFMICRSEFPAGNKNFFMSIALDTLTEGITSISGAVGNNKQICNQLVEEMGEKLNSMDL